jgi:hypothetical protein
MDSDAAAVTTPQKPQPMLTAFHRADKPAAQLQACQHTPATASNNKPQPKLLLQLLLTTQG